MRKVLLLSPEELENLIGDNFNLEVKLNIIEKEIEGESVTVDVLDIYFHNIENVKKAFPYFEIVEKNLARVDLSDIYHTLSDLVGVKVTEIYDFVEVNYEDTDGEYISFNIL